MGAQKTSLCQKRYKQKILVFKEVLNQNNLYKQRRKMSMKMSLLNNLLSQNINFLLFQSRCWLNRNWLEKSPKFKQYQTNNKAKSKSYSRLNSKEEVNCIFINNFSKKEIWIRVKLNNFKKAEEPTNMTIKQNKIKQKIVIKKKQRQKITVNNKMPSRTTAGTIEHPQQ